MIGERHLRLWTPGLHTGVRRHDWVGTVVDAGLIDAGSPGTRKGSHYSGYPPVYVPIELRVTYADGRRAAALLPGVFLSPGWG